MAWLEVHQSLFTHRKTLLLADLLDMPEVYVAGHLISLWTWALDNAPDGDLECSARIIARAAQWQGSPEALVQALIESGYLDQSADGGIAIHDWNEYAGRLIAKRKANAERMRQARAHTTPSIDGPRAVHVQRTESARAGATVQYSTEQNRTEQNQGNGHAPSQAPDATTPAVRQPKRAKRGIPPDLQLTDAMRSYLLDRLPDADPAAEFEHFHARHTAEGTTSTDWQGASWHTWVLNAAKWGKYARRPGLAAVNGRASPRAPTRKEEADRAVDRVFSELRQGGRPI